MMNMSAPLPIFLILTFPLFPQLYNSPFPSFATFLPIVSFPPAIGPFSPKTMFTKKAGRDILARQTVPEHYLIVSRSSIFRGAQTSPHFTLPHYLLRRATKTI